MLIGLANDEVGYIIPKRQWDEKPPFCYGRQKAQYGKRWKKVVLLVKLLR